MTKHDNMYVLEWFGPFDNVEDLREWEEYDDNQYHFYILTGKEKGKRHTSYYVGISNNKHKCIHKRLGNHTKLSLLNRDTNIWIARIATFHKIDRSDLEIIETMLISYWQCNLNEKKKKFYPPESICIINRWFKQTGQLRMRSVYPAQDLSDVIMYNQEEGKVYGAQQLKVLQEAED